MFESSKRVKPWREAVTNAASEHAPLEPPYDVKVFFFIQPPKKTTALYPVAPSIGDIDKMLRATYDALTASGIITDDRHIVAGEQSKEWAGADGPGAVIIIKSLGAS
jgi:Holliday junction resolvase RusA-like endonuclease